MRRGTMLLQYMRKDDMTYREVETKGYFTEVETKDGLDVTLFVYKDGNEWQINDTLANAKITNVTFERRKDALEYAIKLLGEKLTSELYEQRERIEAFRQQYTLETNEER